MAKKTTGPVKGARAPGPVRAVAPTAEPVALPQAPAGALPVSPSPLLDTEPGPLTATAGGVLPGGVLAPSDAAPPEAAVTAPVEGAAETTSGEPVPAATEVDAPMVAVDSEQPAGVSAAALGTAVAEPDAAPPPEAPLPPDWPATDGDGGEGWGATPETTGPEDGPAAPEPPLSESESPMEPAPAQPESVHVEEPLPEEAEAANAEPAPSQGEPEYEAPTHHHHDHQVHHRPSIYIVQISPEMAPVAKVGGLADVVFGLTRELAIRGNHVEIVLPKYSNLRYDQIYQLHPVYNDLWVPWYDGAIHCTVYFGFVHDRKCYFIEPHSQDNFFGRGSIYGYADDVMRYAFFSRAAIEFLFKAGKHPDVIHVHDWQTALVPVLLYEIYQKLGMGHPRVCLTIHNFKHQGVTGMEVLRATGLHNLERFFDFNRLRDNQHQRALNLLKGGIVYSNFVTTVSPRYAFETKDQGQGFGLEPTLHTHHMKYGGVVNGIDYDVWNPEVDRHIPVRYGIDSLDGKYDDKRALRHRLMLADNAKPIVAFIGRLDPQKGLDLVRHAIFYTLERGGQFVLLGSSPDQRINGDFWGLKRMLNDSPDCHLEIGFDEDLSHLIYAGADMILVPSRFEPCGLTQLIAMRYGTVPIVREVGGLADTVYDKDYSYKPLHERNGYVFRDYNQAGLESALGRAIACYYHHPDHFRELMKNAMRCDYSWNHPGGDYLNIYDYIRNK